MKRPKVFIVSSGLGYEHRGMEVHAQDLFQNLISDGRLDVFLVKGAGKPNRREIVVRNLHRRKRLTRWLGLLLQKHPFTIQNISFFLGLIPRILLIKPSTIYLGEPPLFNYLLRLRKKFRLKFRLVFHTGGGSIPKEIGANDVLQLVTDALYGNAISSGVSPNQIKIVPHFLNSDPLICSKMEARVALNLPKDKFIILSVGALDTSVKRMDYLIDDVSKLSTDYYMVLLGSTEAETGIVIKTAREKLAPGSYHIDCVPRQQLQYYYKAADVFALASLREGFGLVTIEAMAEGLPVMVHDYEVPKSILGSMGHYGDFTKPGSLTQLVMNVHVTGSNASEVEARKKYVCDRFTWVVLKEQYVQLLRDQ